jgi:hypothetical protein
MGVRVLGVGTGAAILAPFVATSAAATIVPSQGMYGIKLQMTEAQVRTQLGALRITR